MKLSKRSSALVATAIAAAMLMTACGGSDDEGGEGAAAEGGGTFSIYIGEPENPLVPGNTTESEGDQVVNSLWTGLVELRRRTARSSTTASPSRSSPTTTPTWTITLKDGWTFHDGTPGRRAVLRRRVELHRLQPERPGRLGYFVNRIDGLRGPAGPVDPATEEPTGDPAATEMSGLEVVDDTTFTVTLTLAVRAVARRSSATTPFYPLPQAFFEDPEAFGTQPIGNGPFQAEADVRPGSGHHADPVRRLRRRRRGEGRRASSTASTPRSDTAYTDAQDGNLDIVDVIPPDAIATAEDEFGDRFISTKSSQITYIGFPTYDQRFADPRVRQAHLDGDRPRGHLRGDLRRHPHPGRLVHRAGRRRLPRGRLRVLRARRRRGPTSCSTRPASTAASRSTCGSTPAPATTRGWRPWATSCARTSASSSSSRATSTSPSTCRWVTRRASPARSGTAGASTTRAAESYLTPLFTPRRSPPAGSNYSFYDNPEFDELRRPGRPGRQRRGGHRGVPGRPRTCSLEDMPMAPMFFTEIQSVHIGERGQRPARPVPAASTSRTVTVVG